MVNRIIIIGCFSLFSAVTATEQSGRTAANSLSGDRLIDVLKRRPSFGAVLDRVSRYHTKRGTLEDLIIELSSLPMSHPDAVVSHLIAGMLQIRQGYGAEAVVLLESVEQQRPEDPITSQALGRALRDAGDISAAIAAFERSLKKNPSKSDRRTVYRDLFKLHQRTGNTSRSLKVLLQMESDFPDDRAIQEDIAARLQEYGQLQPALSRWNRLVSGTTNPERRTQYRLSVADVQLRLGQNEQALKTLEAELDQIHPDSWLGELIRARIESVLLSAHGRPGVIKYLRNRLSEQPQEIPSVTRLAALLTAQGEFDEAVGLYFEAIQRRPSSVELRIALIELLTKQGRIREAILLGRELVKLQEAGADEYTVVGRLLLQDPDLTQHQREQQASAVWMRICGHQQDAVTLASVARLHWRSGMPDRATKLYGKAVKLSPDTLTWREELGETLYELGRTEEARRNWNEIAAGSRRTTENLARLSEILEKAGEFAAALQTMQQACLLTPHIDDRLRLARLLRQADRLNEAYAQLSLAQKSPVSPDDRRIINNANIELWEQDPGLHTRIARKHDDLRRTPGDSHGWLQLGLMARTIGRISDAVHYLNQATAAEPDSVLAWQASAEICTEAGLLEQAASANRYIADLSPQYRTQALQRVVELEQQLGRTDQAVLAAELLIRESPEHADSCRQFAELCFTTGREKDGLNCLRTCVRLNPDDHQLTMDLAEIMAERFQLGDSMLLLWQAFHRTQIPDRHFALVEALMETAKQTGTTDRVLDQLATAPGPDPVGRSLCLAAAWKCIDNTARATELLEQAALRFGRDIRILKMQVELAETQEQLDLAAHYQQQLTALSTSAEDRIRLADLQYRTGQLSESELNWIRDARSGNDTTVALRSIDRFLNAGRVEAAELMCQRLSADRPKDWRMLYRLAIIQWRLDHREEAVATLHKIVNLNLSPEHIFLEPESRSDVNTGIPLPAAGRQQSVITELPSAVNPLSRRVNRILSALNWLELYTGDEMYSQPLTPPVDYGGARCTAVGLLWLDQDFDGRLKTESKLAETDQISHRQLADWCSIVVTSRSASSAAQRASISQMVRFDDLIEKLSSSDAPGHQLLMLGLQCRGGVFRSLTTQTFKVSDDPEAAAQVLAAAEKTATEHPEWLGDIGGWPAVFRYLNGSGQSPPWTDVIHRLSQSSNPLTLLSATDLAFAAGDLNAVTTCIQKSMTQLTDHAVMAGLQQYPSRLRSFANPFIEQRNHAAVIQIADLILGLRALSYVPATGHDNSDITMYERTADEYDSATERFPLLTLAADPQFHRRTTKQRTELLRRMVTQDADRRIPVPSTPIQKHLNLEIASLFQDLKSADDSGDAAEMVQIHLNELARDQTSRVCIPAAIALARLCTVQDEHHQAMLAILPVIKRVPDAVELRLALAAYLSRVGAEREALSLMNQFTAQYDRDLILVTERFALEVCVLLRDQERAKLAAQRLFNLNLTGIEADSIAGLLQNIGLTEVSRRFTARMPQASKGRAAGLHRLMTQYFEAGNPAAAVRIARNLLLQPSVTLEDTPVTTSIRIRHDAMNMLSECDALGPVIRQLQSRMSRHDASIHHRHLLVELLRANGRDADADRTAAPLRRSLTEEPDRALRLARQLERQGRIESARDICRYLLQADITLFHRDYYRFIRLFERTGRLEELAEMLLAADLKQEGMSHWGVQQLTERLLPVDENRGLQLFDAAWHAWPAGRPALLANISHDAIWNRPEVFEYECKKLIPTNEYRPAPWSGIGERLNVTGRGRATGMLTRLIRVPVRNRQCTELLQEVRDAVSLQPDWMSGHIYEAVLEAHLGRQESVSERMHRFLDRHLPQMPPGAVWVTACEFEKIGDGDLREIVIRLLRHLSDFQQSGGVLLKSGTSWHASPDYLLAQEYAAAQDTASVAVIVDRLHKRVDEQPNQTEGSDGPDHRSPFQDLASNLKSCAPAQARKILDLARTTEFSANTIPKDHSVVRTAKADQVIQKVRGHLLKQTP
ncbi:MAG: tetratricopeptide repeat protein [Fuerstiella sp.]|nr:tetratricopeptide repeat protein [Fuerstiella sp.]